MPLAEKCELPTTHQHFGPKIVARVTSAAYDLAPGLLVHIWDETPPQPRASTNVRDAATADTGFRDATIADTGPTQASDNALESTTAASGCDVHPANVPKDDTGCDAHPAKVSEKLHC